MNFDFIVLLLSLLFLTPSLSTTKNLNMSCLYLPVLFIPKAPHDF